MYSLLLESNDASLESYQDLNFLVNWPLIVWFVGIASVVFWLTITETKSDIGCISLSCTASSVPLIKLLTSSIPLPYILLPSITSARLGISNISVFLPSQVAVLSIINISILLSGSCISLNSLANSDKTPLPTGLLESSKAAPPFESWDIVTDLT